MKSIEAEQAEFGAEPQIPIGRLGHREDRAHREPVPGCPRGMPVLAPSSDGPAPERDQAEQEASIAIVMSARAALICDLAPHTEGQAETQERRRAKEYARLNDLM